MLLVTSGRVDAHASYAQDIRKLHRREQREQCLRERGCEPERKACRAKEWNMPLGGLGDDESELLLRLRL